MSATREPETSPTGGAEGDQLPRAQEESDGLSRDDVFHVLRNQRRRYAVHYLKNRENPTEIGDVAEQVAAWEYGVDPTEVTSAQRKRVYNSLQQDHFPTLDEEGFADYDERSGAVELTERADQLEVYLEVVTDRDISWSAYYLGLSAVSVLITVGVWGGMLPFTLLPPVAWLAFITTAITVSGAANYYYQRDRRLGDADAPPEVQTTERDPLGSLVPDWVRGD